MRFVVVLAALFVALSAAVAAPPDDVARLTGRWAGADGTEIDLREGGVVVIDGETGRWSVPAPGRLRIRGDDGTIEFAYEFRGDELALGYDGETTVCRRVGPPPRAEKPAPAPAPVNPFSQTADPFLGTFAGDGVRLVLARAEGGAYAGTLEFRGREFPVTAKRDGATLSGEFESEGTKFPFSASRSGGKLVLESGGSAYTLAAEKPAPANPLAAPGPENPLAGGGAAADEGEGDRKPDEGVELAGVYDGRASRWRHPRGWYSFDMPAGWTVWNQSDDGLLLNPGLTATDSLDAIIVVGHGSLDAKDRDRPVLDLLETYEPDLREGLAAQEIRLGEEKEPAKKVRLEHVPGAVKTWKGTTGNGQSVTVWLGALLKRDAWLTVIAVVVEGREAAFLPKAKRVFRSVEPTPPERNAKAEAALAGREFSSSSSEGGNFSGTTYRFAAGGAVRRQMLMSGGFGTGSVGGDVTSDGSYEVVGDTIYLYFRDGQETARFETGPDGGIRAIVVDGRRYSGR